MNTELTQRDKVLTYMNSGHAITNDKAMSLFQIRRLSAIIHVLRQDGYHIVKEWKSSFTGNRYAAYSMPPLSRY